jgi:hypothetical protein
MPLLQVRDFPDDVYEEIAFEAHRQNRTIAQQTVILIKKALAKKCQIRNKEDLLWKGHFLGIYPKMQKPRITCDLFVKIETDDRID